MYTVKPNMAASNCEIRGFMSHSDPASKIQFWEDVSSHTSSVMCLLDSAVSDSRSVSCHTFKKIYYPPAKCASDISLCSDYMRRSGVVRIRNNMRLSCALSIESSPKMLSVSKTAQDLINECLERDPGSSYASAVYPKRRSKVHKISTSSITIEDTDLYCVNGPGAEPAPEPAPAPAPASAPCPEPAPEPEPEPGNATSKPIRPSHVHFRTRRRSKCHSHTWTNVKKPGGKIKNEKLKKLSETLTSKLQHLLDSGARMAGYYPNKCDCKKSDTDNKQAESSDPNLTGPECDLSCLCTPRKNRSQAAVAGALNPPCTITQQESEKAKVKIQSEKSNVNGTDCSPIPAAQTCAEGYKTPDIQASGVCSLNPKVQCECHAKKGPDQTPLPVAAPRQLQTCPEGYKIPDIQASDVCSLNPKVQCECHDKKGPAQTPKPVLNGPAQTVLCECHVKGPEETAKTVAVPHGFETCPDRSDTKKLDIRSSADCPLHSKVSCECHVKKGPDQTPKPVAAPRQLQTCPEGYKTPDIQASDVCSLNPKVQCECHAKKGPAQTPKPVLNGPAQTVPCECHVKGPEETAKTVAVPHDFETCLDRSDTKTLDIRSSADYPLHFKVSCECHVKKSPAQTPKPELNDPAETPKLVLNGPAQTVSCECHVKGPEQTAKTVAVPHGIETRPGRCDSKKLDKRSSADCPLHSKVSCECHVKGTHQIPDEFVTCPGGCKAPKIQSPAPFIIDSKDSCPCCLKDTGLTSASEAAPHESETSAAGCRVDIQTVASCELKSKVSRERHVKGTHQIPDEFVTYPGGGKAPEIQSLASFTIDFKDSCEDTGLTSESKAAPNESETAAAGCSVDIQTVASCELNSKVSRECRVKGTHQIPDEFMTCPGGGKAPEIQSPVPSILDYKVSRECCLKDTGLTSESEAAPHKSDTPATGCRVDKQTVASCQLNSKVSCTTSHNKPQDSGLTDSCIEPGESKQSTGTQSEKSYLTRPDGIRSSSAKYKISAIQLELIGFTGSNDAVLNIRSNITEEGSKANASSACGTAEKSSCRCPHSLRSGLAASNVEERSVATEYEGTDQKSSAKTAKCADIKITISQTTRKGSTSSVKNKEPDDEHCTISEHGKKRGKRHGKNEESEGEHSPSSEHRKNRFLRFLCRLLRGKHRGKSEESKGEHSKKRCNHNGKSEESESDHSLSSGHSKKRCNYNGKSEESEGDHSPSSEHSKKQCNSSCSKRCKKPFCIQFAWANSKESGDEHSPSSEHKKRFLASCWPCHLLFGHPKKEASVGDSSISDKHHKGVNVSKPPRCETSQLRAVNSQISPQISSQSFGSYKSQANKNRDIVLDAFAKLGSTYQSQTSKSTSMLSGACASWPVKILVKANQSTSMLSRTMPSSSCQDSQSNKNQTTSMLSCSNLSSSFLDTGPKINRATSIKSGANIYCAFQDTEMNQSRPATITGRANPSCPFPVTKSCGTRCCASQDSESSKSQTTSIKLCSNPVCPFEYALIYPNQISVPNKDCQIGDSSRNKGQATDSGISPCFPIEGIPTNKPINMHSSYCKICCRVNYSKSTHNFAKTSCANTSTNMHHLCCCDKVANQNNLELSNQKKSASEDSLTKKLLSSIAARNETTQYSSTYLNYCSKEIPVQQSLSQPIRCQCTANPIRSSSSAPSVDKRMSQQLKQSVLSMEIAPHTYCIYCGQTTRVQEKHGHVGSQGLPPPLPRPVCPDPSCPAKKQHSKPRCPTPPPRPACAGAGATGGLVNKQHAMPSYSQTKNAHPPPRASTADTGQTCDLMKKKGLDVECLCAGNENEHSDGDKKTQTKSLEQCNSSGSGFRFAIIPRGSKPSDNSAIKSTDVAAQAQAPQETAVPTCCSANPKSNVSCECALFAQEYCQGNSCPGKGHCLGPVPQKNQTELPCGKICAQKAVAPGSAEHVAAIPTCCSANPKSNVSCECALFAQEHCQAGSCPGKGRCLGPVPQITQTEFPCGKTCAQKAVASGSAEHVNAIPTCCSANTKSNVSCECALFGQEYCQGNSCPGKGHCLGPVPQITQTEFPCGKVCAEHKNKVKPPKLPKLPCGAICHQNQRSHSSASCADSTTRVAKPSKPPKQPRKPKAQLCISNCSIEPPKPIETKPLCDSVCLQKLAGHGTGLSLSMSGSCSCAEKAAPPPNPSKLSKRKKKLKKSDFPCGKICLQKIPTSSSATSATCKVKKACKKGKPPKAKDFTCGSTCLNKLMSGSSVSAVYVASQLITALTKPADLPKQAKPPKAKDFPCSASITVKTAKQSKGSASSSNSTSQLTTCGSAYNSAISKTSSKTTVAKQVKPAQSTEPAKRSKVLEMCFEKPTPCSSTSSSAISKTSSKTKVAKPAKSAGNPKLTKGAEFLCKDIGLQKVTSSSNASSVGISKSSSATSSASAENKVKLPIRAKQPKLKVFSSNSMCFQVTPCGSACYSGNSKNNSKTKVGTQAKPAKPSKAAKQPNAADFLCVNICFEKLTPSASDSSLDSKSSCNTTEKPTKPAKPPKNEKKIIPCGNAAGSGIPKSSSESKPAKPLKSAKQPKAADFPCGDIGLQKQTPSGSAPGSASSSKVAKPAKQAKPPKNEKKIILCGSAASSGTSKSSSESKPIPPKSAKPPKAADFPCGDIGLQKQTSSGSASGSASSSKTNVADFPCGNIRSQEQTPSGSAPGSASSAKQAKPPKNEKEIILCGSAASSETSKSSCKSKPAKANPSTTQVAKPAKQAKPPKNKKEIIPSGSASGLVVNKEKPNKDILPCRNAFSQIPPSASEAELKNLKPSKQPKAKKGAKSPCTCSPTSTPCPIASNLPKTAKPPKSSKAKSKPPCVCPPSITPCARSTIATPTKSPKSAKSPCSCPPSLTPCGSASKVTSGKPQKSPKPPKSPEGEKGAKSLCVCPPNISPCGSGQLTPGRPRTPVKLMNAKSYKGDQEGVISLEEYEKNKKKKKKTKLMNTDVCVPTCQSECSMDRLQKPARVVVPEFKKSKKRDKWLGIFPCNRQCLSPKSADPCQCLASEPKGGKKYIDCTELSLSGVPKSKRSRLSCECQDTGQAKGGPNPFSEDPVNQGFKVQIRKKM